MDRRLSSHARLAAPTVAVGLAFAAAAVGLGQPANAAVVTAAAAACGGWAASPVVSPSWETSVAGVDPLSASDAYAVGFQVPSGQPKPYALHWDGTSWTGVPAPATGDQSELNSVSMVSDTNGWAAGLVQRHGVDQTLAEHWNGTAWAIAPTPNLGTGNNLLTSVATDGGADGWAVGYGSTSSSDPQRHPLAIHWDGSTWSASQLPEPSGSDSELLGVAARTAADAWAVGVTDPAAADSIPLIEHFDGSGWSVTPSPGLAGGVLDGVAVVGPDDVWAVGYQGSATAPKMLAEHWDGTSWSQSTLPALGSPAALLRAVTARGPSDVWAAGTYYDPTSRTYVGQTLHWDGNSWSAIAPAASSSGTTQLRTVAASPTGELWIGGTGHARPVVEEACASGAAAAVAAPRVSPARSAAGRTASVTGGPQFTSPTRAAFPVDATTTFSVATDGQQVTFSASGALPDGVTFHDNGDGTAKLSGQPAVESIGAYPLVITATSTGGTSTQLFTLTVAQAPTVTNACCVRVPVGKPLTIALTTVGYPAPVLSLSGALPTGVTFTDNGNGTATITGTPSTGTATNYPLTLTARNSAGAATKSMQLRVVPTGVPIITSPPQAQLYAGQAAQFVVSATGSPVPTLTESGALPPSVHFRDNHDGTATISGTPHNSQSSYPIEVTANNGQAPAQIQSLLVRVDGGPVTATDQALGAALGATTNGVAATVADENGDGRPDLFLGGTMEVPPQLFLNGGGGRFSQAPGIALAPDDHRSCTAAAVGGSAVPDIACTVGANWGNVLKADNLFVSQPGGGFTDQAASLGTLDPLGRGGAATFLNLAPGGPLALFVGTDPVRSDGLPDPNRLYVDTGSGFNDQPAKGLDLSIGGSCVVPVDVNADHYQDLLLCAGSGVRLFRNNAGASFTDITSSVGLRGVRATAVAVGDMNGDGRQDIDLVNQQDLLVMLQRADGTFHAAYTLPLVAADSVAAGDANGDGAPDLYVGRGNNASIQNEPDLLLLNGGSGAAFTDQPVPEASAGRGAKVFEADTNGDGLAEFLVLNSATLPYPGPVQLISSFPAS
jgi:hypothetical protein